MLVEGINLTPDIIKNLKWYQSEVGIMDNALNTFDKTITLIAQMNDGAGPEEAVKALKLITELCNLKEIFSSLDGREVEYVQ